MLESFVYICERVSKLDEKEFDLLLPNPGENCAIDKILFVIVDPEEIEVDLQREEAKICAARGKFADVVEAYSSMQSRMKPDSSIVQVSNFEDGTVRIQSEKEVQLASDQQRAVAQLTVSLDSTKFEESD